MIFAWANIISQLYSNLHFTEQMLIMTHINIMSFYLFKIEPSALVATKYM